MSDHLPECPSPQIAQAGHAILSHASCICDRLRACQQRTLSAARDAVAALDHCPECSVDAALAAIDALRGDA